MKPNNYLNNLFNDDCIGHYSRIETAIEQILFTKHLRFSPFMKTQDPFEYHNIAVMFGGLVDIFSSPEDKIKFQETARNAIIDTVSTVPKYKLCCFCRTNIKQEVHQEAFCFSRPRMWAQYGDSHHGCCLIFSKSSIIHEIKNMKLQHKAGNIKYYTSERLNQIYPSGDYELFRKYGNDKYTKTLLQSFMKNYLFTKHTDFKNENEYRILISSDNEYEYINISKALKGIAFSDKISAFHKQCLVEYCASLNIPLIKIDWSYRNIYFELIK